MTGKKYRNYCMDGNQGRPLGSFQIRGVNKSLINGHDDSRERQFRSVFNIFPDPLIGSHGNCNNNIKK